MQPGCRKCQGCRRALPAIARWLRWSLWSESPSVVGDLLRIVNAHSPRHRPETCASSIHASHLPFGIRSVSTVRFPFGSPAFARDRTRRLPAGRSPAAASAPSASQCARRRSRSRDVQIRPVDGSRDEARPLHLLPAVSARATVMPPRPRAGAYRRSRVGSDVGGAGLTGMEPAGRAIHRVAAIRSRAVLAATRGVWLYALCTAPRRVSAGTRRFPRVRCGPERHSRMAPSLR